MLAPAVHEEITAGSTVHPEGYARPQTPLLEARDKPKQSSGLSLVLVRRARSLCGELGTFTLKRQESEVNRSFKYLKFCVGRF